MTSSSRSPSSIKIVPPIFKSCTKLGYETAIHSRVVSSSGLPTIFTFSPILYGIGSSLAVVRTSGPFVSIRIAIRLDTVRTFAIRASKPSRLACAVFIRTTFIPASKSCFIKSTSQRLSTYYILYLIYFLTMPPAPTYMSSVQSRKSPLCRHKQSSTHAGKTHDYVHWRYAPR